MEGKGALPRYRIGVFSALSILLSLSAQARQVTGVVRSKGSGRVVAEVQVFPGDGEPVVTDSDGRFGVDTGAEPSTLRLVHPDYRLLRISLDERTEDLDLGNVWMLPSDDEEIVVLSRKLDDEVTRLSLDSAETQLIPGTFGDPVRVTESLPGVARPPVGEGVLIIRGSDPKDSAVYVDGIRIPVVYHVLGFTSIMAPGIIESVDYLPGTYGVEYGRSMGGVVNLHTRRDFDEALSSLAIDLMDAELFVQTPLGRDKKHGLALGVRRSHLDAVLPAFGEEELKPHWWDYQLKWVPEVGARTDLAVLLFSAWDELVFLDQFGGPPEQFDFATHRLTARISRELTDDLSWTAMGSVGRDHQHSVDDSSEFDLGFDLLYQARSELAWSVTDAVTLKPGLDLRGGLGAARIAEFNRRGETTFVRDRSAWRVSPDLYFDSLFRPLTDRSRWVIRPGVRWSVMHIDFQRFRRETLGPFDPDPVSFSGVGPRLGTRFRLFDPLFLKGGTGLYHQTPEDDELGAFEVPIDLTLSRAWASSVGFEWSISPAVQLDVEGFYKDLDALVVPNPVLDVSDDPTVSPNTNEGTGYARGVELMVRHSSGNDFFGWVSYTLSQSRRATLRPRYGTDLAVNGFVPFEFDQPHLFSAQGGTELPEQITLSAQIRYGSGNPTSYPTGGIYNADWGGYEPTDVADARLPPFLTASVRGERWWTFRRWRLNTSLELIGVVRGLNAEGASSPYDFSQVAYEDGVPFIPNLGLKAQIRP